MAAKRKRDYKAEYARRNQRAKEKGYPSYGVRRRHLRELRTLEEQFDELTDITDVLDSPMGKYKKSRIERLKDFGASQDDVTELYAKADQDDFWKAYRNQYDRLRMG